MTAIADLFPGFTLVAEEWVSVPFKCMHVTQDEAPLRRHCVLECYYYAAEWRRARAAGEELIFMAYTRNDRASTSIGHVQSVSVKMGEDQHVHVLLTLVASGVANKTVYKDTWVVELASGIYSQPSGVLSRNITPAHATECRLKEIT
jgi:hypothetical protein